MRCSRRALLGGVLALAANRASAGAVDPFALPLERLDKGRFARTRVAVDAALIAMYFGASWCGPCRAFVPRLAAAYPRLRAASRPVEVVFVSDDLGCRAQRDYIVRARMPWPVLACTAPERAGLRALGGAALPGLVVLDRDGTTLIDSWRGGRSTPGRALAELLSIAGAAGPPQ